MQEDLYKKYMVWGDEVNNNGLKTLLDFDANLKTRLREVNGV
jgi:hypothetical protein